jgi:Tol biopolymer transport system component
MVIIDRSGRPLGVLRASVGPIEYDRPSWSPDGRSLVYPTLDSSGTALAVWTAAHGLLVRTAPDNDNGADFGYCLWSPDASAVLCPTFASGRVDWDLGLARGGPLFSVPAPGAPIIWLPAATDS